MAFCGECGSRIPESSTVCPTCGAAQPSAAAAASRQKVRVEPELEWALREDAPELERQSYSREQREAYDSYAPMSRSKEMTLAENEKVVRRYLCSEIKRPRCSGYLTVTNKRLFFEGKSATSRIAKEVSLDAVSGLDCYYGLNMNIPLIILGVVLFIGGIVLLSSGNGGLFVLVGIALLLLGALSAYLAFRKSFFLSIFSSKTTGAPIQLGQGIKSLIGNGAIYTLQSNPTADTDRMLNELGALVIDLQTMGDHAIEKWSKG